MIKFLLTKSLNPYYSEYDALTGEITSYHPIGNRTMGAGAGGRYFTRECTSLLDKESREPLDEEDLRGLQERESTLTYGKKSLPRSAKHDMQVRGALREFRVLRT